MCSAMLARDIDEDYAEIVVGMGIGVGGVLGNRDRKEKWENRVEFVKTYLDPNTLFRFIYSQYYRPEI